MTCLLAISLLVPLPRGAYCDGSEERELAALEPESPPLVALPLSEAPGATTVITAEEIVRLPGSPSQRDAGGLYVQHEIRFGRAPLHLITGVRLDTAEGLGTVTSPRIALVAEPAANLVVRGSWGRAYRAPTWNERYIYQRFLPEPLAPGLILTIRGSPDLEREREDSLESGVSWRLHSQAVLKLDFFYNRISRFIERPPGSFAFGTPSEIRQVYANRPGEFSIRGFEATAITKPAPNISVTAGYGYRDLSLDLGDPSASYAPRLRGILSVAWNPHPS